MLVSKAYKSGLLNMNLYLIPKNTLIYLYRIENVSTYSFITHQFLTSVSDKEAFIDVDEQHIITNEPTTGAWYYVKLQQLEFGVEKKDLIKV